MAELKDLKRAEFERAQKALEDVLARTDIDPIIARDSALMRFTFTSEVAWKAVRLFVAEKGGKDALVPKAAYREAQRLGIVSPEETEVLLVMVDDRNRLAHDYSEKFVSALFERLTSRYAQLLRKLCDAIRA